MAPSPRGKLFLLCIRNKRCEDLELRKVYDQLPDAVAAGEGYVRVRDESGQDCLYPQTLFVPVALPSEAERALARRPSFGAPITRRSSGRRACAAAERRRVRRQSTPERSNHGSVGMSRALLN